MYRCLLVAAIAVLFATGCENSDSVVTPDTSGTAACQTVTSMASPDGSIPAAPPVALAGDRDAFGAEVVRALNPILIGSAVDDTVERLQAAGWTVTVGQKTTTPTSATADARWDRLVVWTCAGLVAEVSFD